MAQKPPPKPQPKPNIADFIHNTKSGKPDKSTLSDARRKAIANMNGPKPPTKGIHPGKPSFNARRQAIVNQNDAELGHKGSHVAHKGDDDLARAREFGPQFNGRAASGGKKNPKLRAN